MNRYLKILMLLVFTGIVIYLIAIASGYTSFNDCEYYKQNKLSIGYIFLIAIISYIQAELLKIDKGLTFVFVAVISLSAFLTSAHLRNKKVENKLEKNPVVVTKAVIRDISYHQFTTFLAISTAPKKFKSTLPLKQKSDLGDLKVNDTILIKYSQECHYIWGFQNLSPTKTELNLYSGK